MRTDCTFTINHAAANPFATMLELDGATDVAGESFRAFDVIADNAFDGATRDESWTVCGPSFQPESFCPA